METEQEREDRMKVLAGKLHFEVEKTGSKFSFYREVDLSEPVRHDDLTLDEAEDLLNRWKLRGLHGG